MDGKSYRDSHLHKGTDYHETFSSMPHRAMLWNLERKLLRRLVLEFFPTSPPLYLDFACGTGRILAHLAPFTRGAIGVDISASMLAVARCALPDLEIIEADLTRYDQLGDRKFDLITAFRFLPNAEPTLRMDTLGILAGHLNSDGVLIFNNHKNSGSMARHIAMALGTIDTDELSGTDRWMSRQEVGELVSRVGLRITREYHFGVLPFTDRHMLRPTALLESLETVLNRVGLLAPLAQNLIYVCRRV